MKIEIKNFKNIDNLKFELEENKINFLFGMSGTGKSSIVKGLLGDKSEKNAQYGKSIDDVVLDIIPQTSIDNISLFNEETQKNLLINKVENENIYSILFSNDSTLENVRSNISIMLSNINSKRQQLLEYVSSVDEMIKRINGRKNLTKNKFSSNSSIEKLKVEISNPKYKIYSNFIHNNGVDYVRWVKEGTQFELYSNNKCPFCGKKLTGARVKKTNQIMEIEPEQYKIISDSKDILEKLDIDIPNFSYKRDIRKLEKRLYDCIENKKIIINMYEMIDSYSLNTLDINNINKITLSESLKQKFPETNEIINEFNQNIKELKTQLGKIMKKTKKVVGNNLKKLNDYLNDFSIPYEFSVNSYNTIEKKATVFLISKKDNKHEDRTENLSYGEKNLISLLLFLVSNEKEIVIIDDPASSYDDNRRKIIYDLLFDFHKDNTYIVLSHDQVFVKYALLAISKLRTNKYLVKTGNIMCLENHNGRCEVKAIAINDFDSLYNQITCFIYNNNLCYYRTIINLRILAELNKNSKEIDRITYSYLSAILHSTSKNEILQYLEDKNYSEERILTYIKEKYNVNLIPIPDDIKQNFNYDELTNFEKIAYTREKLKKEREGSRKVKSFIEKEFDDIVHLNNRYFVSLNPYKFDIFSEHIYSYIENE